MLGEGPTSGINVNFGSPDRKFSINFSKARLWLSLYYNGVEKNSLSLKPIIKMLTLKLNLVYEVYLMDLQVSLKGNMYDVKRFALLNINKYLIVKSIIK